MICAEKKINNGEKHIRKCINSVVNQTYKNLEILIINDGSTDNTLSICECYKDNRIKIITTENLGLSMSRNIGLDNATGKFIYFVDADDFIEKDTIEYLYNLCKKNNTLISTCNVLYIFNDNYNVINTEEKVSIIPSKEFLKSVLLLKNNAVYTWNKLMSRNLFDNLRFENRMINDIAFTHKLIMRVDKIACSNQIKYFYLRHKESITAQKASTERLIDIYNVYVDRYNYTKKVYPDLIENNAAVLKIIIELYLKNNKELEMYLNKNKAIEIYKKIFTFKVLKCNIGFREKIKIISFRINPKFNKKMVDIYLKLRKNKGKLN